MYKYGRNLSAKELTNQYVNVSYVSNNNSENYFIYSVVSPYKFTRFVLNVTGEFILYAWNSDLHQWNLVWKTTPHLCEIWVSAGTMAFVMSGIHLFVIATKDLDQKIQEGGTYLSTQEGVIEARL